MMTLNRIERLHKAGDYRTLVAELTTHRPEAAMALETSRATRIVAAAIGLIRLDEYGRPDAPAAGALVRELICHQDTDGGWGDPAVTALALRALLTCQGKGETIDRGIAYLVTLQKEDGAWPNIPLKRMPGDGLATAFVLYELASSEQFRNSVRYHEAIRWMDLNHLSNGPAARKLWDRARTRCLALRGSGQMTLNTTMKSHAA